MEVLGLCAFCSKPARHTCPMCGRAVCPEHFSRHSHLCHRCSPESRERLREGPDRKMMS